MKNVFKTRHGQYEKPEIKIISNCDIIRTSDYGEDLESWGEWEDIG